MNEKRFELRLCNNGTYYLWNNSELTDIGFDKFNKESANELVDLLNELHEENQSLKDRIAFLEEFITSGVEYTYSQNIYDENEQLKKVFNEMIRQTEIEINPDKPTLYSGTFIFTAEEFYFIRKIMEMD